MPYTYPGQIFDHTVTALKGWPNPYALDIDGTLSANVDIGSVGTAPQSGQVVHIETLTAPATGKPGPNACVFEMGALKGSSNNIYQVPLFLWPSYSDFDVSNPGVPAGVALAGTSTETPAWYPIVPTGTLVAFVGLGAFELETTEFDSTKTYYSGQLLRCVSSNTDADAGKLTNVNSVTNQTFSGSSGGTNGGLVVLGTETVVGVVSRGKYNNADGKSVLAFWPHWIPGSTR